MIKFSRGYLQQYYLLRLRQKLVCFYSGIINWFNSLEISRPWSLVHHSCLEMEKNFAEIFRDLINHCNDLSMPWWVFQWTKSNQGTL